MTTPAALLAALAALGGRAFWEQGSLVFWVPGQAAVPPELESALVARRQETADHLLLSMLPEYGVGLCQQCGRILVAHHLGLSPEGWLVCHDTADCLQAREAAREAKSRSVEKKGEKQ